MRDYFFEHAQKYLVPVASMCLFTWIMRHRTRVCRKYALNALFIGDAMRIRRRI